MTFGPTNYAGAGSDVRSRQRDATVDPIATSRARWGSSDNWDELYFLRAGRELALGYVDQPNASAVFGT